MNYFFHQEGAYDDEEDRRAIELWRNSRSSYGHVRPGHPEGDWGRECDDDEVNDGN